MRFDFRGVAAIGVAVASFCGAANAATFAEYEAVSNFGIPTQNIQWMNDGSGGTLSAVPPSFGASSNVRFSFLEGEAASYVVDVPALFTLVASSSAAASVSATGFVEQGGINGGFAFTYQGASPITFGGNTYTTGANLLSGDFTGARLYGVEGSPTAGVLDASTFGSLVFNSDFVSLDNLNGVRGLAIEMTSVSPFLSVVGGQLQDFGATSTGSFQASLLTPGNQGVVPEPATWAFMILGVAGSGLVLRRKRQQLQFAAL